MASLGTHFDATTVDPNAGFPIVPPDTYIVHIIESDMRPTKDGTGQYLRLVHEICEGPRSGDKFTVNLNLVNANQQTVDIAQRQLSQICHAIGVMSVSDSEQLHARRMRAEVVVQPPRGQYGESNAVRRYLQLNGDAAAAARPGAATATAAAPAKAPGSSPPWRKSA